MKYKGIVQQGGAYGHVLGFPTANIPLTDESLSGIYAAEVTVDGKTYHAAVYADTKRKLLESHLLDFDGNLYGKEITIDLKERIRDAMQFTTADEAKEQIAADISAARAHFNRG